LKFKFSEESNFFPLNSENTKLVHKMFEEIKSKIDQTPEFLRQNRLGIDKLDIEINQNNTFASEKKSFNFPCCGIRKNKNVEKSYENDESFTNKNEECTIF